MKTYSRFARAQRMTIVNAMLLLVVLIVVLQLWLLTATVNAYLGGDAAVTGPAALVSLVTFFFLTMMAEPLLLEYDR